MTYFIPSTPSIPFGQHDPAYGCLCPCLACAYAPQPESKADYDPWLDGDYDLIGSNRRYEIGE